MIELDLRYQIGDESSIRLATSAQALPRPTFTLLHVAARPAALSIMMKKQIWAPLTLSRCTITQQTDGLLMPPPAPHCLLPKLSVLLHITTA